MLNNVRFPTVLTTRWRYSTKSTTNHGRDSDRISWACPSDGCCSRQSAKSRWTRWVFFLIFDFQFDNDITFAFHYLQLIVITGWTVSSAVLCSLIFGLHQMDLHPVAAAAYSSLSHTLWALCLSWTVIACATGHGGKSRSISNFQVQTRTICPFPNNNYCCLTR